MVFTILPKKYTIDCMTLSKEQLDVKNAILDWYRSKRRYSYLTLGGYAGTGKSSLVSEVRKSLPSRMKVAFCAFTGKAASVLKSKLLAVDAINLNDYIGTIHGLCYRVRTDPETQMNVFEKRPYIDYDLIVVDEASMVNSDLFNDLREYGIPMLFVGDHGQLPPISTDNFNLMENPMFKLEEVHRFGNNSTLLDLSVMARNGDEIPFKRFDEKVIKTHESDPIVNDFIRNNLGDFSNGICLCGTNNTRVDVNQLIRFNLGLIDDITDKIPRIGDRIVCLKNNSNLVVPIYNGLTGKITSMGIVEKIDEVYLMSCDMDDGNQYKGFVQKENFGKMKYTMDEKEFITVKELMKIKSYVTIAEKKKMRKIGKKKVYFDPFDFGYCLTVHKAQGSEWGNVLVFDEACGFWDREYKNKWLYTAITRSNDKLMIIG